MLIYYLEFTLIIVYFIFISILKLVSFGASHLCLMNMNLSGQNWHCWLYCLGQSLAGPQLHDHWQIWLHLQSSDVWATGAICLSWRLLQHRTLSQRRLLCESQLHWIYDRPCCSVDFWRALCKQGCCERYGKYVKSKLFSVKSFDFRVTLKFKGNVEATAATAILKI